MSERALTDSSLRPLPEEAVVLLRRAGAAPRLAAHLRVVHDVAVVLTSWVSAAFPEVAFDRDAVLFGAATHDIGKTVHVAELSGPGTRHEAEGERILLAAGVVPGRARFAGTHGSWGAERAWFEDHLVSAADMVWRGRRQEDLEGLAAVSGREPWEVFLGLDECFATVARGADAFLDFQNAYPLGV